MDIQKTKNSTYTVNIENEKKEFTSFEEAKLYLKKTGLSDDQINNLFKTGKQSTVIKRSLQFQVQSENQMKFSRLTLCPHCNKELHRPEKKCPYCFKEFNRPFWKKILGID